jgi:hypothetical protein
MCMYSWPTIHTHNQPTVHLFALIQSPQSASELYRLRDPTCRRILMPAFVDSGVSRGQRGGSLTVANLGFLDRSCYFLFQIARHLSSRG